MIYLLLEFQENFEPKEFRLASHAEPKHIIETEAILFKFILFKPQTWLIELLLFLNILLHTLFSKYSQYVLLFL